MVVYANSGSRKKVKNAIRACVEKYHESKNVLIIAGDFNQAPLFNKDGLLCSTTRVVYSMPSEPGTLHKSKMFQCVNTHTPIAINPGGLAGGLGLGNGHCLTTST